MFATNGWQYFGKLSVPFLIVLSGAAFFMATIRTFGAPTLFETLVSSVTAPKKVLQSLAVVVAGSLLLTLSAKVEIPLQPVPFTFQSLVVLALGVVFGPMLGLATVMAYLAQGAIGLPVFAGTPEKGIGLAYMVGPTGGYLLGFAVAAFVTGWLARAKWDRNVVTMALAMLIGNVIIYAFGVAHLASLIGMEKAVQFGLKPFIFFDVIKTVAAALVIPSLWKLFGGKPSESV